MRSLASIAREGLRILHREGLIGLAHRVMSRARVGAGLARSPAWLAYRDWIARNEPDGEALKRQREDAAGWVDRPLVTVAATAGSRDPEWLVALREDLSAQSYDRWEDLAQGHPGTPAGAGDYVALVAPGTRLAPDALYEAVRHAAAGADAVYSDHDRVVRGLRCDPLFKPEWSPETLLSVDLLAPFALVRRSVLAEVGSLDDAMGEAAAWDLTLRIAERTDRVTRVPRVLAHTTRPSLAPVQARAALEAHMRRLGLDAVGEPVHRGAVHLRWPLAGHHRVSAIVPTRDRVDLLRQCLESLQTEGALEIEVIVVDNGSEDAETIRFLDAGANAERLRVLRQAGDFNWSAINNAGARLATGDLLLFLNNDIKSLRTGWIEELARWALRPGIGVVGPLLLRPDGSVQHAGVVIGLAGVASHPFEHLHEPCNGPFGEPSWYRDVTAVTGACQMVRAEVFAELRGFDESFLALYSDVDFCVRSWRRGYRNMLTPHARLLHRHGMTRGGDERMPPCDFAVALERFGDLLQRGDPFFSPSLSYWSAIPWPRRADEPAPFEWLATLVEILQEQFDGPAARMPQPIRPLLMRADERVRRGGGPGDTGNAPDERISDR